MGVKNLPRSLSAARARPRPVEPAAAVERGTRPGQRTVISTLADLPAAVAAAEIKAPASCCSARWPRDATGSPGSSAARYTASDRCHPSTRPGKRPRRDVAPARRRGRAAAGDPDRAAPRDRRGPRRGRRPAHLRAGLPDQPERGRPPVRGDGGPGPRRPRARQRGRRRDRPGDGRGARRARCDRRHRAERFVAEALLEALAVDVDGRPVLVARAAEARDVLPEALAERGAQVDVVALYETLREPAEPAALEAAQTPTTSPSPRRRRSATCLGQVCGRSRTR